MLILSGNHIARVAQTSLSRRKDANSQQTFKNQINAVKSIKKEGC